MDVKSRAIGCILKNALSGVVNRNPPLWFDLIRKYYKSTKKLKSIANEPPTIFKWKYKMDKIAGGIVVDDDCSVLIC
ncbi:Uncharacterised protein [uncultured archaeon]|nr:Uncharacterised protein [uncultured archaeon]